VVVTWNYSTDTEDNGQTQLAPFNDGAFCPNISPVRDVHWQGVKAQLQRVT
jgi:hypothetical protein